MCMGCEYDNHSCYLQGFQDEVGEMSLNRVVLVGGLKVSGYCEILLIVTSYPLGKSSMVAGSKSTCSRSTLTD